MTKEELIIKSPVGFDPAVYNWPSENQDNNGASEIIETIKWVFEDFPELNSFFRKDSLEAYDSKSYESMKLLCELYNNSVDRILDNNPTIHHRIPKKPSINLVQHIIHQAYNQSVIDPDKLNSYEPFSAEVYGETSFDFVRQMIEEIKVKDEDVFIDLGSGVGQVVLQVAALTNAKLCIGIEKADVPATYADGMSSAFKFWMNWYGKQFSEYHLMKGDFFNEKYRDTINNGTFIFVNNYAFGPEVDHKLKLRFQELKDGARIVSSKPFCSKFFRISDRTLNDIGSIMRLEEIHPKIKYSVSWTNKSVSYFLHEIDRRKLEEFFRNCKAPRNKTNDTEMTKNRRGKSQLNHSSNGDQSSNDSSKFKDDSPVYGPTTRKAWSEYCKTAITTTTRKDHNDDKYKETVRNGNHKKTHSNDLLDVDKLMTSDSDNTCDTLVEDKNEDQNANEINSDKNDDKQINDKLMTKRTRKSTSEKKSTKFAPVNDLSSDSKRPGRPRKPKQNDRIKKHLDSLDLLHEKTVLSISSTVATELPAGCIDRKLSFDQEEEASSTNTNENELNENIENVQNVQNSEPVEIENQIKIKYPDLNYNFSLDCLVNNFRNQVVLFLDYMKKDDYKTNILNEIEKEKSLHSELKNRINSVENQINEQLSKGVQSLKKRLSQVDIYANDPDEMAVRANEIIAKNKELKNQVKQMDNSVQQLEDIIHKKFNQINLTNKKLEDQKMVSELNSSNNLNMSNNLEGLNNFKNLNNLNNLNNLSNNLSTNSKPANSRSKRSSKQTVKDANNQPNNHQTSKNSHLNSQLNQPVKYVDNNNLSKSSSSLSFNQANVNNSNFYNNQSLSNLNNFGNLTSLNNLNTMNSNLNNLNNSLNAQMNYESNNTPNSLHKSTTANNQQALSQQQQASTSNKANNPNHGSNFSNNFNNNLNGNHNQLNNKIIDKHLDRIKEKVNKSMCNNNVLNNDNFTATTNNNQLLSNNLQPNHHPTLKSSSRKELTSKLNGATHQFPELEEDVIKNMILAAFNDDGKTQEMSNINNMNNLNNFNNLNNLNSLNNMNNHTNNKPIPKPRKPRQPRATKNNLPKNDTSIANHSNSYDQIQKQNQSNKSLNSSQSALSYEQSQLTNYTTQSTTDFSSLFKNLHNASTLTSSSSFLSSTKKSSSAASASTNNNANEIQQEIREENPIKLTLKKIDREGYTLVKSPEAKSPEKTVINSSNSEHLKRKHNNSPDHKTKKSKSPKYSSSLNAAAYEPEKQRLILKLTNLN